MLILLFCYIVLLILINVNDDLTLQDVLVVFLFYFQNCNIEEKIHETHLSNTLDGKRLI